MADPIDEKEVLELLLDHQSDDLKKARRNLMVVSLAVVLVYMLDLKLTDLKVFGLDLSKGNASMLLWAGILVVGYWLFMMHMYIRRDDRIYNERLGIFEKRIERYRDRASVLEEKVQNFPAPTEFKHELSDLEAILGAYDTQINRTKVASFLVTACRSIEYLVPVIMAITALGCLLVALLRGYGVLSLG